MILESSARLFRAGPRRLKENQPVADSQAGTEGDVGSDHGWPESPTGDSYSHHDKISSLAVAV